MEFLNFDSPPASPSKASASKFQLQTTISSNSGPLHTPSCRSKTDQVNREYKQPSGVPTATPSDYSYDNLSHRTQAASNGVDDQSHSPSGIGDNRKGKKRARTTLEVNCRPSFLAFQETTESSSSSFRNHADRTIPCHQGKQDELLTQSPLGIDHESSERKRSKPAHLDGKAEQQDLDGEGKSKKIKGEKKQVKGGTQKSIDTLLSSSTQPPCPESRTTTPLNQAGPSLSAGTHGDDKLVQSTATPSGSPSTRIENETTPALTRTGSGSAKAHLFTPDEMLNLDRIVDIVPNGIARICVTDLEGNRPELGRLVKRLMPIVVRIRELEDEIVELLVDWEVIKGQHDFRWNSNNPLVNYLEVHGYRAKAAHPRHYKQSFRRTAEANVRYRLEIHISEIKNDPAVKELMSAYRDGSINFERLTHLIQWRDWGLKLANQKVMEAQLKDASKERNPVAHDERPAVD